MIFPAAVPVEIYIPERKAEFLLSNAVDARDYQAAVEEVRKLGIDPGDIPHYKKCPQGQAAVNRLFSSSHASVTSPLAPACSCSTIQSSVECAR